MFVLFLCAGPPGAFGAFPSIHRAAADRYKGEGLFWARLGDFPRSIDCFEKAILASPHQPLPYISLAWDYRFVKNFSRAVSLGLRALEMSPDLARAHEELWRSYSALGRREGYDQELVLRETYHIEKILGADPNYVQDTPEVMPELQFLISTENRLEEAGRHILGARILPEGTPPESVAAWRVPQLPDDGIARGEQFKALDRAIAHLQDWERNRKSVPEGR